jgi:hemerythrin-like metal-binding protein
MFMRFPKPLYEGLPYLYGGIGLVAIAGFDHVLGKVSGAVFVAAALLVLHFRRHYRLAARGREQAIRNIREIERQQRPLSDREVLEWRPAYRCANRTLNEQHQQLFEVSRSLLHAVESGQPKSEVDFFIATLISDIEHHFHTEESLIAHHDKALGKQHHLEHVRLLEKGNRLASLYQRGEVEVGEFIHFIVHDLVLGHTLQADVEALKDVH